MKQKLLSVIVPMLNEAGNIIPLHNELTHILGRLAIFSTYEIIFVNDGSTDQTLAIAKTLALTDPHIKIISFIRNFGHEQATYAGLCHAQGDAVVLIDADRQDPAELILEFEKEYAAGFHIVYGQRTVRHGESYIKKITSKAFYPVFRLLTRIDLPNNVGDFCMLSRKAVDALLTLPEKTLFIRGMIYWTGLSKKAVPFVRRPRGAGTTKYNYTKLTMFALDNIISFSILPMYLIVLAGFFITTLSLLGVLGAAIMHLLGWTITVLTWLFLCLFLIAGALLFCMGFVGLYVGRVMQEVKNRPIFLVDEYVNFEHKKASR